MPVPRRETKVAWLDLRKPVCTLEVRAGLPDILADPQADLRARDRLALGTDHRTRHTVSADGPQLDDLAAAQVLPINAEGWVASERAHEKAGGLGRELQEDEAGRIGCQSAFGFDHSPGLSLPRELEREGLVAELAVTALEYPDLGHRPLTAQDDAELPQGFVARNGDLSRALSIPGRPRPDVDLARGKPCDHEPSSGRRMPLPGLLVSL